jgi:hypothetical protein
VSLTQEPVISAVCDIAGVPLDTPVEVDDIEYARIMRRIGISEGEPGMSVSAFNSSI